MAIRHFSVDGKKFRAKRERGFWKIFLMSGGSYVIDATVELPINASCEKIYCAWANIKDPTANKFVVFDI